MKLTDWYEKNQKPVRIGLYEREYDEYELNESDCDYWDGTRFRYNDAKGITCIILRRWRGLSEESK